VGAVVEGWGGGGGGKRALVEFLGAKQPTAVFPALTLRGRSGRDTSPVRTGRKAAASKNPVVIFAWDPGKIQTKASTPRPADGGHATDYKFGGLTECDGGATSGGRLKVKGEQPRRVAADRSRTRVQRGSASTHHLRKIAALFSRNSPAPMTKEILYSTSCGRRARGGRLREGP